jgi:hypothetical protein
MERPRYAVVAKGDGHDPQTETEPSREARIRKAAYDLYQARGHVHGYDVNDWLAAEAALACARVAH